jgi:hypothetical protein
MRGTVWQCYSNKQESIASEPNLTRKVVAIALANKMARVAWALLAHGGTYRAPVLAAAA